MRARRFFSSTASASKLPIAVVVKSRVIRHLKPHAFPALHNCLGATEREQDRLRSTVTGEKPLLRIWHHLGGAGARTIAFRPAALFVRVHCSKHFACCQFNT